MIVAKNCYFWSVFPQISCGGYPQNSSKFPKPNFLLTCTYFGGRRHGRNLAMAKATDGLAFGIIGITRHCRIEGLPPLPLMNYRKHQEVRASQPKAKTPAGSRTGPSHHVVATVSVTFTGADVAGMPTTACIYINICTYTYTLYIARLRMEACPPMVGRARRPATFVSFPHASLFGLATGRGYTLYIYIYTYTYHVFCARA